jgi:hypothetical protein
MTSSGRYPPASACGRLQQRQPHESAVERVQAPYDSVERVWAVLASACGRLRRRMTAASVGRRSLGREFGTGSCVRSGWQAVCFCFFFFRWDWEDVDANRG